MKLKIGKKQIVTAINWIATAWLGYCGVMALHYLLLVTSWASYDVPSGSMLPALQVGDYMLVNKWVMGARIFDLREAAKKKQFPIYRLPGFSHLKRNDIMVFNAPYPDDTDSLYISPLLYYVKRCIAVPGDTLEIRNGAYHIRGVDEPVGNQKAQRLMARMKKEYAYRVHSADAFPHDSILGWTLWDFGPLPVPAKGQVIQMDSTQWKLYHSMIAWEQKKTVTRKGNDVFLNDSLIHSYQFQENYYFAGGDNMLHSNDSRYWGLVPEPFVAGKAVRLWKSVNPYTGKLRWERFWKKL